MFISNSCLNSNKKPVFPSLDSWWKCFAPFGSQYHQLFCIRIFLFFFFPVLNFKIFFQCQKLVVRIPRPLTASSSTDRIIRFNWLKAELKTSKKIVLRTLPYKYIIRYDCITICVTCTLMPFSFSNSRAGNPTWLSQNSQMWFLSKIRTSFFDQLHSSKTNGVLCDL